MELKEAVCTLQQASIAAFAEGNPFEALDCTMLAGHYDMAVYDALPEDVRKQTLVVLTLREPVELMVSLYHYIPIAREVYCDKAPCPLLFPNVSAVPAWKAFGFMLER